MPWLSRPGLARHGLWSVSRGLESRGDYKRMMVHADMPRQGDLDGRGNFSRDGNESGSWRWNVMVGTP
jgi:hypothetical protein